MRWTSALAIYFIFWFFCLFLVLPFHARPVQDASQLVPGQADSAPTHFPFWRIVLHVSAIAGLLFGAYYLNYVEGWISAKDIEIFRGPPDR